MQNKFKIKLLLKQPKLIFSKIKELVFFKNKNFKKLDSDLFTQDELKNYNLSRKYGYQSSICYAADSNLYFDIYGNVFLCCYNRKYKLGNISENSIEEIWNGKLRKEAKLSFDKNNLVDGCTLCYLSIKNNNGENAMSKNFDSFSFGNENFPSRLDFELSNVCNLECVMCNGEFSNLIRKNREHRTNISNPYNKDFIQQIKPYLKHASFVNFLGGEPQLINIYYKLWEELIKINKALIRVQTNATILNSKFASLVEHSSQFQISLSVDTLNEANFLKIRVNGIFNDYINNIKYYISIYNKGKIDLSVSICPMRINSKDVLDVINYFSSNKVNVFLNHFHSPYYLSLENEAIDVVKELYNNIKPHGFNKKVLIEFKSYLEGVLLKIHQNNILYNQNSNKNIDELLCLLRNNLETYFKATKDSSF